MPHQEVHGGKTDYIAKHGRAIGRSFVSRDRVRRGSRESY